MPIKRELFRVSYRIPGDVREMINKVAEARQPSGHLQPNKSEALIILIKKGFEEWKKANNDDTQ